LVSIASTFMTGTPKLSRIAATRWRRLMAVQLEHVGLQGADDLFQPRIVGIHDERDCLGAIFDAKAESARASSEILRGLGGKNTKPTTSAPAASATSRVRASKGRRF